MTDPDALSEFVERARMLYGRAELDAAAAAVLDAFDAAAVPALLLKGPALARLLYAANEPRGYADVDLLVPPAALPRAREVIAEAGFNDASARVVAGVDDVAGTLHSDLWTRRGERVGPLLIDLHWRLPGWNAPPEVSWEAVARGRTELEIGGRRVPVFGREALALHLATHAAQHGSQDGKALGDLARGIERWSMDVWDAAARLAEEVDGTAALAAGLRLVPKGAERAQALGLPPTDELTWAIAHRGSRPRGTFHLDALLAARGVRARANVLRRSLLPTRLWIERRYAWAERGTAWTLGGYAAHLLSTPVWAARAWRFRRCVRRAAPRR